LSLPEAYFKYQQTDTINRICYAPGEDFPLPWQISQSLKVSSLVKLEGHHGLKPSTTLTESRAPLEWILQWVISQSLMAWLTLPEAKALPMGLKLTLQPNLQKPLRIFKMCGISSEFYCLVTACWAATIGGLKLILHLQLLPLRVRDFAR